MTYLLDYHEHSAPSVAPEYYKSQRVGITVQGQRIRVTSDVYGSLLPTVDEGVTIALEQRFAKFSRTNRGLEPDVGTGPELS